MATWVFDSSGDHSWWEQSQNQKGNRISFGEKYSKELQEHGDELLELIKAQPNGPGVRQVDVDLPGLKGKLVSNGQWIEGKWGDFYEERYATSLEAKDGCIIRHWAFANEAGACVIAESVVATKLSCTYITDLRCTLKELGEPLVSSCDSSIILCWGEGEQKIELGLTKRAFKQALQSHFEVAVRSQLEIIKQRKVEWTRRQEQERKQEQAEQLAKSQKKAAQAKRATLTDLKNKFSR